MCALKFSTESQPPESQVTVCYATQSDGKTLDRDAKGRKGNPFATALIELSSRTDVEYRTLQPVCPNLRRRSVTGINHLSGSALIPPWIGDFRSRRADQEVVEWLWF